MIMIDIFYNAFCLGTQIVAPNIPCFQVLNRRIKIIDTHPHKPIYSSFPYESSNVIRLTHSGYQVEYYTTIFFWNAINMYTTSGLLTGDYWCLILITLFLVLMYVVKRKNNRLWHHTLLMGKLCTCIKLSRKPRQLGDTWSL